MTKHATYTDQGSGDPIVFLHGFCESTAVWADFANPLQQKFRTVALDLPGFGDNTQGIADYSMESMADYVKQQLEQLNVKKCILVGHSMGGYVGMAFAERYSHMLSGLCLFHSSALPDTNEKKENRNKTIEFVEKHGVEKFMQSFIEPLFYSENRDRLRKEIALMKEIGTSTPQESVTKGLAAMRDRQDRTDVLAAAKFPVLFIFGKEDGAVPLDKALEQCHLPDNSMVYFLGKTGHMGMFERTYETRKALEKFAETIYG
ncbi:alpha/beta fold hydrolase [Pontibacter lucknowensis]|uniref:Pimeloyl-ACP methyl ester carboxylesterase n=1 Tax=Pontibacter lucknowensis TaxID=1077936 RepID=A0A1N6U0H8_9BACT|nr:alpha/beta hydrolase [Pontibacter lucknowensis]SIQ59135.1 Pimeloyl-ACP methyl ester carboxylesterase [Pontibacter lucknowensis]